MTFELAEALEILEKTPQTLRSLLSGLSPCWLHGTYGPDTFSPFDVVGHLLAGERSDWLVRVCMIFKHGTARSFEKYDRYAQFEQSRGKTIDRLLTEFASARRDNLAHLRNLRITPTDLTRCGLHPALGQVTLEQLLATWVAHDMNHLAQIAKAIATQYESAVGPWREYLGILRSPSTPMDAEGVARRANAQQPPTDAN